MKSITAVVALAAGHAAGASEDGVLSALQAKYGVNSTNCTDYFDSVAPEANETHSWCAHVSVNGLQALLNDVVWKGEEQDGGEDKHDEEKEGEEHSHGKVDMDKFNFNSSKTYTAAYNASDDGCLNATDYFELVTAPVTETIPMPGAKFNFIMQKALNMRAEDHCTALVEADKEHAHCHFNGGGFAQALASTVALMVLSCAGVFLISFKNQENMRIATAFCVALGAGVMLGDVFLHLVPGMWGLHASHIKPCGGDNGDGHDHGDGHEDHGGELAYVPYGIVVLVTFGAMVILRQVVPHEHDKHADSLASPGGSDDNDSTCSEDKSGVHRVHAMTEKGKDAEIQANAMETTSVRSANSDTHEEQYVRPWLVIIGDGFHNIADGLALGALFATGNSSAGWLTFFAIVLHEVPEEIGTFGILLRAGWPWTIAMLWNLAASATALLGTVAGFFAGTKSEAGLKYVLAIVAGQFLYNATLELLPAVEAVRLAQGNTNRTRRLVMGKVLPLGFMFLGFSLLIGLTYLEEVLAHGGHGHDHDHGHDH